MLGQKDSVMSTENINIDAQVLEEQYNSNLPSAVSKDSDENKQQFLNKMVPLNLALAS